MTGIFSSITDSGITVATYLICTAVAAVCGIMAAAAAAFRSNVSKSFVAALILLPPIVETVIIMVNGNIGTGVAVMGAFSLIRFRSVAGKARDIAAIFLVMTAGLACAAGYVGIALLFTLFVCAAMVVISVIPMADEKCCDLRITVPETLNFYDEFSDVFSKYTNSHRLITTKTCNLGSMYKLYYRVELKNTYAVKEFMDELRCRNGNLEIALSQYTERSEEL